MSIEVANESGAEVDEQGLVAVARHTLERLGVSPLAELSLLLVDVDAMERLHVRWMDELDLRGSRGVSQSSMPDDGGDEAGPTVLGDVVLCPVVAERQAQEAGHSTDDELQLLCVHGVLHLLGFDHGDAQEHAEMFGLQAELLQSWNDRVRGA